MLIKTKFDLGDICYYIWENKVQESEILEINYNVSHNPFPRIEERIKYIINRLGENVEVDESYLFKTKEELLDSL